MFGVPGRCTRLGLLCIPNPNKQGRPLAQVHIKLDELPNSGVASAAGAASSQVE